ncbi:MAG TPA: TolC family protein [Gemmataceae bacterium]|nr:TolC family protein [Gemmataceae bacterium]
MCDRRTPVLLRRILAGGACLLGALGPQALAQSPPTAVVNMPAPMIRSPKRLPELAPPAPPAKPAPTDAGPEQAPPPQQLPQAEVASTTPAPIDLPYALHLVNASNPTIAVARERMEQAYERQRQAGVLWLPNLWLGGNPNNPTTLAMFYHHDGYLQSSTGANVKVDKNALFLGAGAGLNFELADAFFAPLVARRLTEAEAARAQVVTNDIQLDVALTYLDLLRAYGALAINAETLANGEAMYKMAQSGVKNGLAKPADANRASAEVEFRRQERLLLQGQAAAVSARLAQLLLLPATIDLEPADQAVLPITLVPDAPSLDDLVATGLMNRPELAADRALVAAALASWRGSRWRPLIPSLQVTYYGGDYAGGTPGLGTYSGRDDVYAQAVWQLQNFGLHDLYVARENRSRYREATLHVAETTAEIGAEVTAAAKLSITYERTLPNGQEGVRQAELTWQRLYASSFGLGSEKAPVFQPLEALIAEQQLNQSRLEYLDDVIGYDRQQFRLYWAMGQPPEKSLPCAVGKPVEQSVLPPPRP